MFKTRQTDQAGKGTRRWKAELYSNRQANTEEQESVRYAL